jgi:hypothetical protein
MFLTGNQGEEYYSEIFLAALTEVGFDNGWKSILAVCICR